MAWQGNFLRLLGLGIMLSLALPTWATEQSPKPQNMWADIWQRIIRSREREKPRTSRGLICPVMPEFIEGRSLWHDHPTFVWQGKANSIAVYAFSSPKTSVWTSKIESVNSVAYNGEALQPGKRYIWEAASASEKAQVIFEILDQASRDRITAQLSQLETQLDLKKASSNERVMQRIDFFLDHKLFLDAVQELYSVQQPSQEVQALQHKLVEEVCSDRSK